MFFAKTSNDLLKALKELDTSEDGVVSFDEFKASMNCA